MSTHDTDEHEHAYVPAEENIGAWYTVGAVLFPVAVMLVLIFGMASVSAIITGHNLADDTPAATPSPTVSPSATSSSSPFTSPSEETNPVLLNSGDMEYIKKLRVKYELDTLTDEDIARYGRVSCERIQNGEFIADLMKDVRDLPIGLRGDASVAIQEGVQFYCPGG